MKRLFICLIITISFFFHCSPIFHCNQASAEDPLQFGFILPLSGMAASYGLGAQKGASLAYSKLSPAMQKKINLTFEDDVMNIRNSLSAFKKLQMTDKLDVLFNLSSGTGMALAPLAEKEKIPFFSGASDANVSRSKKYTVNFWTTPESEGSMMLSECKRRGIKKVARFSSIHNGAKAVSDAFDSVNDGSVEIVLDEEFLMTETDFRTATARLKRISGDIDAVMFVILPGQCGLFARQIKEAGVNVPYIGFEMFEEIADIKASGGALIDQWYINSADGNQEIATEYRKLYPDSSVFAAFHGYDAVNLVAAAIEANKGVIDTEQINNFIHSLKDYHGALGIYSSTDDNRYTLPAAVKIVRKDGFEQLRP